MVTRDGEQARWAERFRDRQQLRDWLENQSHEVIVVFAIRAALRTTPKLAGAISDQELTIEDRAELLLPLLRILAASWAAAKHPYVKESISFSELYAAGARATDYANYFGSLEVALSARTASLAIFRARDAIFAAGAFVGEGIDESGVTTTGIANAATAARAARAAAADAAALAVGVSPKAVLAITLWHGLPPDWALEEWERLKAGLPTGEHWDVWTRWYEAIVAGGDGFIPEVEIFRATRPESFWQQPVAVINKAIKDEEARWTTLAPRPAAHDFRVVDGRIDAAPEDAAPLDAPTAQDLRDETLRKAKALQTRLERMQADESLRADVAELIARLTAPELRPGLLLSSIASLDSALRAYDTEEGRKELSPDALKAMRDVAETARTLNATFPKAREIEAERVAQALPMERLAEIERPAAEIVVAAAMSDAVSDGAVAALETSAQGVITARSPADRAKQLGYLILDLGNFGRAGARHIAATGARITKTVGREIGGLGADCWKGVRKGLPKGVEKGAVKVGSMMIVGGVSALMGAVAGPFAALGAFVSGMWGVNRTLQDAAGPAKEAGDVETDRTAAEQSAPPAPKPRRRKPSAPKA